MTRTEQERLAVLETEVKHLTGQVDDMSRKVTAMHDLLMQARGARWVIIAAAAVGGFVASKLPALASLFPFPR